MDDEKQRRAGRRANTAKRGIERLRLRARVVGDGDAWAEATPHWFARVSSLHCDCRKKQRGNPKVGRGCCPSAVGRAPSLRERTESRRLSREAEE